MIFVRANLVFATHDGCRAGAVIPPPDPDSASAVHEGEDEAEDMILINLQRAAIDCSEEDNNCQIEADVTGASPMEVIHCDVSLTYSPIIGLLPVPETISATSISRMEIQR